MQSQKPNQWRRLTSKELGQLVLGKPRAGWRLELLEGSVSLPAISYLDVAIDKNFPNSQPRILAPQINDNYEWPHIEDNGLLCLKASRITSKPHERILQHLNWAHELLNFSQEKCRREFEREFSAYWSRRSAERSKRPTVVSLMKPSGASREVAYYSDPYRKKIIVADDKNTLSDWLENESASPRNQDILTSWLFHLPRPWIPSEYPETGFDILDYLPDSLKRQVLIPGKNRPLFCEINTPTGSVFIAMLLKSSPKSHIMKGFRSFPRVPTKHIVNSFGPRPVFRCPVQRVDGNWIHGRDKDTSFKIMNSKRIAVIGCGSLGSMLIRLLAQSGIGNFLLIDADGLLPANIARHAFGMRYVGQNKAIATAKMLEGDFPHIQNVEALPINFEWLKRKQLDILADVDLIISAGINFEGDASLDVWRRGLSRPPPHLCTWTEAFAIVGHAVLLYGADALLSGFNESEQPLFRLTDWPEDSNSLVAEAGCGNVFQPHGSIDLQSTVSLAANMVLEVFMNKIPKSCRRVWQGKLGNVMANGGISKPDFVDEQVVREFPWL